MAETGTNHIRDRLEPLTDWQPIVLGLMAAALASGLIYWLSILPAEAELAAITTSVRALEAKNALDKTVFDEAKAYQARLAEKLVEFEDVSAQISLEAERERVVGDIENISSTIRGGYVRWTVYEPRQVVDLQKKQDGVPSVSAVPIHTEWVGNWVGFKRILAAYTYYPKLLTVQSFSMKARDDARGGHESLEAKMELQSFFKRYSEPRPPAFPADPALISPAAPE
jgi:Tfp pilus assembly protein PilO